MEGIDNDLFNIASRIKQIDGAYKIYRNHEKDRFEVYWRGLFAFVVPFDYLDERTLVYTKKTRRENADEIERDIDEGNLQIEKEKQRSIEEMKVKIKDYVNYDNNKMWHLGSD